MDEYIKELGNDFYDMLPDPSDDAAADYEPSIDAFIASELEAFRARLDGHLEQIWREWCEQRGDFL